MVVIACPTAALTGITQDRRGMPSRCTVQAPQSATPQPNFVPFMPSRSRKTHRRGMSGSASTLCDLPLIFSVSIALPPISRTVDRFPPRSAGAETSSVAASSRGPVQRGRQGRRRGGAGRWSSADADDQRKTPISA